MEKDKLSNFLKENGCYDSYIKLLDYDEMLAFHNHYVDDRNFRNPGRTKSNIVEEALKLMKQHQGTIKARAAKIATLTEDEMLDVEEYMKNRREKRTAELYNTQEVSIKKV